MFEFVVVYPLAFYGLWVMLGMPKTEAISALGTKLLTWVRDKVRG